MDTKVFSCLHSQFHFTWNSEHGTVVVGLVRKLGLENQKWNEWMNERGEHYRNGKTSAETIFFQTLQINSWCGVHHVLCNILAFIQAAGTIIKAIVAQRLHQAPHLPSSFIQGSVPKLSIELLNEIWLRMRDSMTVKLCYLVGFI